MTTRYKWSMVIAAVFLALPMSQLACADEITAKFINARTVKYGGILRLAIDAIAVMNNRPIVLVVPNNDDKQPKLDPRTDLFGLVKTLKTGDVINATYAMQGKSAVVSALSLYPMKPGEELPNAFVFDESYDKKEGKFDYQMVDVKRFGQPITLIIPNRRDPSSRDTAPDPELLAEAAKLKPGDIVLIDAAPSRPHPQIKSIELYTEPQAGHFIKSQEQEIETGQKGMAVEIESAGKTITALVPGHLDGKRWVLNSKVLAEVRRLRPNSDVMFRATDDNGKTWLRAIQMAPRQSAHAAGAESKSASGNNPGSEKK